MDASFPEILFILHSHDSCRPSGRLWGKPGSNPGLLRDSLVSASGAYIAKQAQLSPANTGLCE
jgi:hypothetical protein